MALLPANRQIRLMIFTGLIALVAIAVAGFVFGMWFVPIVVSLLVLIAELIFFLLRNVISQEAEERLDRGTDRRESRPAPAAGAGIAAGFRRSLAELRGSRLAGGGLYALPWYLVIGETGAGKSALIGASGLELPAEFAHVAHGGATQGCEWWFTNEAILLDTAGRFAGSDANHDRQEWRQLLRLLRKARPKRSVNGVIVALSAPRLLSASAPELEGDARALRRRLNELTDSLSVDAPIYVVVTQLDRVEGFPELVSALPSNRLHECLGFTNAERRFADAGDLVGRALEAIRDRVDTLVPEMVLREPDPARRRRVFAFPHELQALSKAIDTMLRTAFAPSVYEETPFLRGVYLTSARQGGGTASAVLSRLGQDWERAQYVPGASGWFLRDLFRDVIIGDQDLALPHSSLGPRARRAIFATVAALCAVAVTAWSVAGIRILEHQNTLVDRARRVKDAPSSLETVERLRRAIRAADDVTVLGRLGLGPTLDRSVDSAREVFLWAFGTYFEEDAKSRLRSDVRKLDPEAFEALAELALDLGWLMNRAEAGPEQRPRLVRYARRIGGNETDQQAFGDAYDDFVRWLPEAEIERRLELERRTLATASSTVLSIQYLEQWSAANADARPPVRYRDLGIPAPGAGVRDGVSSAYTRATWESVVRGLLSGVRETKGASEASIRKFVRSYVVAYDSAWERFLLNTPVTPRAGDRVKDSPYHDLLRRIRDEMQVDLPRDVAPEPEWVGMLEDVLREEAASDEESEAEDAAEEIPPWGRYLVALEEVAKDVEIAQSTPEDALETAVEVAGASSTSFHRALDAIREIVPHGDPAIRRKLTEILELPVLSGLQTVLSVATRELDREWRTLVAGPFGGPLGEAQLEELYGDPGGVLRQFQETWLDPFFKSGVSRPLLRDLKMPFGAGFLKWLDDAGKMRRTLAGEGSEIAVRLIGVPSRVVTGQVVESKRVLQVDCSDQLLTFEYRPSRAHTIAWNPSCTEVKLRVSVLDGGVERELPVRTWRGPLALPSFFHSAARDRSDFVWKVEAPDRGIELAVPYRMRSGSAILDISHRPPPDSIGS